MPGHTPKIMHQFEKTFNVYQKAKKQLHSSVFLVILQGYCKLVVFGTLRLSGYVHQKRYYHLAQNVCVYLHEKNQLHSLCFYGDISRICKVILGTLDMPGYTHPK